MNARPHDRRLALCGIGSVVVELAGTFLAMGSGRTHSLTWSSSTATIAHAFAKPSPAVVWVGAYLEVLSMGLFLAFAVWASARLGGGLLGSLARGLAVADVAVSLVSLAVLDTEAYLAGHGLGLSAARALVVLNGATFVSTWFLTAFFLLAVAPLALGAGRRVVGWSVAAIAAVTLVAVAADPGNLGQFSSLLALIWVAGTSVALARGPRRAGAPAVAHGV